MSSWKEAAEDAQKLIAAQRDVIAAAQRKIYRLKKSERFFLEMDAKGEPWPSPAPAPTEEPARSTVSKDDAL